MAKQSVIKLIKAKPNAKGKRSHLPLTCSVSKCENDFLISTSKPLSQPKRICAFHRENPPQSTARAKNVALLKSMGLI